MSDRSHPPGNPPSSPPPPTPRPNDPTHPGREMTVVQRDEYRISLLLNGRPVAAAIRTGHGWHIPLTAGPVGSPHYTRRSGPHGERVIQVHRHYRRRWLTADTMRDALHCLYALALWAAQHPRPLPAAMPAPAVVEAVVVPGVVFAAG